MPFLYEVAQAGPLRQGEIIGPVWIHRAKAIAGPLALERAVSVETSVHERMLVIHADCDLAQDFKERDAANGVPLQQAKQSRLIPEVIMCDAFEGGEIRNFTPPGSQDWKRVQQNQNERFHSLPGSAIAGTETSMPALFLDFKQTYAESPGAIYGAIMSGNILRVAVVPPVYVHDLMHRFFAFHSRVGLPE